MQKIPATHCMMCMAVAGDSFAMHMSLLGVKALQTIFLHERRGHHRQYAQKLARQSTHMHTALANISQKHSTSAHQSMRFEF